METGSPALQVDSLPTELSAKPFRKKSLSRVWLFSTPWTYTVHGILQARILEWVAFPFSRGPSQPRDWTQVPTLQADSLLAESQGKPIIITNSNWKIPSIKQSLKFFYPEILWNRSYFWSLFKHEDIYKRSDRWKQFPQHVLTTFKVIRIFSENCT